MTRASFRCVDELVDFILPFVKTANPSSFSFFLKAFLQRFSVDTLQEFSDDTWKKLLLKVWDFYEKSPQKAKVECFSEDVSCSLKDRQSTALMILNPNVPFLVDSLQHFLNQEELGISFFTHPVFSTQRDASGALVSLETVNSGGAGGQEESLIFCLFNEALSSAEMGALEEKVRSLFEKVTCVVQDWSSMRTKASRLETSIPEGEDLKEIKAFFQWIDQGHFTFLGYAQYQLSADGPLVSDDRFPSLGLLRPLYRDAQPVFFEGAFEGKKLVEPKLLETLRDPHNPFLLTKANGKAPIVRPAFMDVIGFKIIDAASQKVVGLHCFLGLFTARAYTQSARDIPLVRLKVRDVLEKSGLDPSWHDGKRLIHFLETLPRDELFQISSEDLFRLGVLGLEFQSNGPVRLFVRFDSLGHYVSCFICVPRDHYRAGLRYKMGNFLATCFHGVLATSHVHLESLPFAWIHCLIHLSRPFEGEVALSYLNQKLTALSLTWDDRLKRAWIHHWGEKKGLEFYAQSRSAFPRSYEDYCSPEDATEDFKKIQKAVEGGELFLSMTSLEEGEGRVFLKIYAPRTPLLLSDMIPILENMGFTVMTEIPLKIQLKEKEEGWVHLIQAQALLMTFGEGRCALLEETFKKICQGETENDVMNRLVCLAGFTWRECLIFRAYTKYLNQIQIPYSQAYVEEILLKHVDIIKMFRNLFHARFNPVLSSQRIFLEQQALAQIQELLKGVVHQNEERVLRIVLSLICATLRTNYYQTTPQGDPKPYLSFKFDCHKIEGLPLPLPLYEIFVYSERMEGVHLRGGKVARGGLRWSDRPQDYRLEILDLMKTQMVKNAVTVPVGSKGGFIVKGSYPSPEAFKEAGIESYKIFIRGLLDLTDNRVGGTLVTPPDMVPWDDGDPYLVVAADKGTAARSNDANALAKEYGFWLGDAFASGGSHGYNHKQMAITSRGAWKSVEHHFQQIGLNPETTPFTVVGIGDMSGDVFGNGMLLSHNIQLLGAFDHRHIFLDPFPDPAISYQERERLFHLPTSSWADYQRDCLSPGGGIFSRDLTSIPLSEEVRRRFDIQEESLSPDALIRVLLRASVDLLWIGGIGTFVKASFESHADAGDKTNDFLRVNGRDLRAKVVAEGGNLGFTQRGRIEYALSGGHINTDALDNSGGVDCSDHEVNLKILFQHLMEDQVLTEEERNTLLVQMTDEVACLVLSDNYWQNQAVALAYSRGDQLLEEHGRLIKTLEQKGLLNRHLEALPSDEELQKRKALKLGLTRPELCVLLAYGKIDLYTTLLNSSDWEDPLLEKVLYKYFPHVVGEKFSKACDSHPLKREIIATLITNIIVNTLGPSFINEMCQLTGAPEGLVVKATWVVRKILKLGELERAYLKFTSPALQQQVLWFMDQIMKRLVIWFLRQGKMEQSIEVIVERYQKGFDELRDTVLTLLPQESLVTLKHSLMVFFATDIPRRLQETLLVFDLLAFAPDMIQVSLSLKRPVVEVARLYYALAEFLGLRWMYETTRNFLWEAPWHRRAFREIREQMFLVQQQLVLYLLSRYSSKTPFEAKSLLSFWQKDLSEGVERYLRVLEEIQKSPLKDFAPFVLLERALERLYEKTAGACTMTVSY